MIAVVLYLKKKQKSTLGYKLMGSFRFKLFIVSIHSYFK